MQQNIMEPTGTAAQSGVQNSFRGEHGSEKMFALLFCFLLLWSTSVEQPTGRPQGDLNIISRDQWGAIPPKDKEALKGPAQRAVIHHTAGQKCSGLSGCKDLLQSIQRFHMNDRKFADIGYNFLVGSDGSVFEGRGWGVVGAHAKGHNHDSVGIAFMGNFNDDTPSPEALSSVKKLLQSGVSQGFLKPGFALEGHRDLGATECPGNKLYAALAKLKLSPE